MRLIRIVGNWVKPHLLRQSPARQGVWGNYRFTIDPVDDCDYVIVLNFVPNDVAVSCPPDHVWALIQEPADGIFRQLHVGNGYYRRIYTTDPDLRSCQYVQSQAALDWHVEKDYDYLKSCGPPEKGSLLSWITSDQSLLPGHQARMRFLARLRMQAEFDLFGRGFAPIDDKWTGLAPYCYSIAVENYSSPLYWTEKLMDCFLAWTMPIYHGCTRITEYFPEEAMVLIDIEAPDAVEQINDAIQSDRWVKNRDAIAYARELVLDKYQLFPFIAGEIHAHEGRQGKGTGYSERITIPGTQWPSLSHRTTVWQRVHAMIGRARGKWSHM